jgi:hypothetical protein
MQLQRQTFSWSQVAVVVAVPSTILVVAVQVDSFTLRHNLLALTKQLQLVLAVLVVHLHAVRLATIQFSDHLQQQ